MRFVGIALLAIGVVSALFPSAHAFVFLMGANYEKGERPVAEAPIWPTRTISFFVNTDLSAMGGSIPLPLTSAELLQSAEASVNAWAAACRADIRVEVRGTTTSTYDTNDAINVIQWDNRTTGEGNYYGTSTGTLAAATTVLRSAEFADCDIVLNGNASTTMKFAPALGEADLRSVLTHEIGHCLGLDHPIEPPGYTSVDPFLTESTMVQTVSTGLDPSDPGRRDINQDDRDGLECLYERGKPFRTGKHCASYTGTNGQGALTGVVIGGPIAVDTVCGGDSQGRNAHPSLESGDGCVSAAVAADGSAASRTGGPFTVLGGTGGFLFIIAGLVVSRLFCRRSLRRVGAPILGFALYAAGVSTARAADLELAYGVRAVSPSTWNSFAGMDPQASAWDRAPGAVNYGSLSEIRTTAFVEETSWGKWGGSFIFTFPKTLETNAKAENAAEQSKRTSIAGFRVGPDFRWFPIGIASGVRWFVGGRFGFGIFYGDQTFSNPSASGVSYRAWAAEFALSTGVEIPVGALNLVFESGYSRHRSSYFASTGTTGGGYADFPSGTRLATNTGAGAEDVRFDGSGFFATVGIQMKFGSSGPSARDDATKFDDYERAATPISDLPPRNDREIDPIPEIFDEVHESEEPAPTPGPDPVPLDRPHDR